MVAFSMRNIRWFVVCMALVVAALASGMASGQEPGFRMERVVPAPQSALGAAALRGDLDALEKLLDRASEDQAYAALVLAVQRGRLDVASWLLKRKIGPDVADPAAMTALSAAVKAGRVEAVKLLCAFHADPDRPIATGERPLHQALKSNYDARTALVAALIACGADPRLPDGIRTLREGQQRLPAHTPTSLLAAQTRDLDVVRLVLAAGAPVNETRPCCVFTALMAAARDPKIFGLFIDHGANPLLPANNPSGILHVASCDSGYDAQGTGVLRRLLRLNPLLKDYGDDGELALACAAERANLQGVKLMLKAGADPNAKDSLGRTALSRIALQVASELADAADSPAGSDQRAARWIQILDLLLKHGADPAQDQQILDVDLPDGALGQRLSAMRQLAWESLLAECRDYRSTLLFAHGKNNEPPARQANNHDFAEAEFVQMTALPPPSYEPTISPDGRWLAYWRSQIPHAPSAELVLYDLREDAVHQVDMLETFPVQRLHPLRWSADSKRIALADRALPLIDLSGPQPRSLHDAAFTAARRPGSAPCLLRWEGGMAWEDVPERGRSEDSQWSYDGKYHYQLLHLGRDWQALAAVHDGDYTVLARHSVAELRLERDREEARLRAEMKSRGMTPDQMRALQKFKSKFLGEFERPIEYSLRESILSAGGRYLYYRLAGSHRSRHFVLDVESSPARAWEISAEILGAAWHPNDRELYFVLNTGAESDFYYGQHGVLAVARFP